MMAAVIASAILLQSPLSALAPPRTDVAIRNGESSGYIEAVVNGKDVLKVFDKLSRGKDGKADRSKTSTVWQAGPNQTIALTRRNWSTSDGQLSVYLRYYSDQGVLIGVTSARRFVVQAGGSSQQRWVFTRADLVK